MLTSRETGDVRPVAERTTTRLTDVDTTGLTREQRKTARATEFTATTTQERAAVRAIIAEDVVEDYERGLQRPGHRGGARVRLVWADTLAFQRWQNNFGALPGIDTRYALVIGPAAYENPGDDVTPPSGRRYTEIQATEAERDWLEANGVTLCNPGGFTAYVEEPPL